MKTSYKINDVQFLLKDLTEVALKNKADGVDDFSMSIEQKEKAIQSNLKHYSEIVNLENPPTKEYLDIFYKVLNNKNVMDLFTDDILTLAAKILSDIKSEYEKTKDNNVMLVSLVRAGTPIGILLKRILEQQEFIKNNHINLKHYSVSIIRDKDIDENAINHIIQKNKSENIYFIDGWTGKGVITKELTHAILNFNQKYQTNLKDTLYVLADIVLLPNVKAGSYLDYLIPSSILNSTVSGLISRTILNHLILPNDFHGSIYYENLNQYDVSNEFIKTVMIFINANCNHFILIGAENALFGLVSLMNRLSGNHQVQSKYKFTNVFNKNILPFEPVFKIHYFKRICPISYHPSIELKDFQSGDCLVTFSKNKVLQYADLLKKLGYKVSILYGDLPLETRIAQSENFKNGLTDVLVSTDVIGMGLNLPIKRLIFETMDKFDGEIHRPLTNDEFKQIAGRSGRYQQTGAVAYMNANSVGYSPYYRCIVFKSQPNQKLNFNIDYDFEDFDDIYIPSEVAYPLKRHIWDEKQIQSVLDEMNTSSEIMMKLDNQEFTFSELMVKLSESNYPCHPFTVGLNIQLLEEYKNKFKLGFSTAYSDYVKFITKELGNYFAGITFKDNTLKKTLKHFNQIFKKNDFDCEMAIGLCQAPLNEDLEEEYMDVLGLMFNQDLDDKKLKDWESIGKYSVTYANNLYRMMKQSSINDSDFGILERMMIMNAWLHKKMKKIACIQDKTSESSEMIKKIRKNFAKEIQFKISQKLIADQLFTKCKTIFHKEYNDFELKMKPLYKEINQFDNKRGELKNKIKKAKKSKQYDEKKLYEKEMDDFMKQNQSHIDKVKNEVDKLKKEQFNFINQKVIEELKKYY
mgnify:CR=1 FL=1